MRSLVQRLIDSMMSKEDKIIDIYLTHLHSLTPNKRQHFMSRLDLALKNDEHPHIDIQYNPEEYMSSVVDVINEVTDLIIREQFREVIDKYVKIPYTTQDKSDVYDWLNSDLPAETQQYLAIGHLLSQLDIIYRNNCQDMLKDITNICHILDVDRLLYLHYHKSDKCRDTNGTLYVNYIGNLMNVYHICTGKSYDFSRVWKETRSIYTEGDYSVKTIYGVTHAIINGMRFYTRPLDVLQYSDEISYLNRAARYIVRNNYKNISLDCLCELALCIKLSNPNNTVWLDICRYIESTIDEILQSNKDYKDDYIKNLEKNEHCNILFIMLKKLTMI